MAFSLLSIENAEHSLQSAYNFRTYFSPTQFPATALVPGHQAAAPTPNNVGGRKSAMKTIRFIWKITVGMVMLIR